MKYYLPLMGLMVASNSFAKDVCRHAAKRASINYAADAIRDRHECRAESIRVSLPNSSYSIDVFCGSAGAFIIEVKTERTLGGCKATETRSMSEQVTINRETGTPSTAL